MASSSEHTLTGARREALRQIITHTAVGRQADLVRLLARAGHRATQSSVSRDLRELGVAKLGDRYVLPDDAPAAGNGFAAVAGFVREVQPAGASLTVVRTSAGAAQSVAIVLDRARSVRRYLTTAGIPETKIRTRFFGEYLPLRGNETAPDRAINRRVRVHLIQ